MRVLLVLFVTGCISTNSVQCPDGTLCPAGTSCRDITGGSTVCATPDQLTECDGKSDLAACGMTAPGSCHNGVCLPIVCGNGLVDLGEACDDGNTITGDGCSGDCSSNETCGNGVVDPLKIVAMTATLNETCDDNNLVTGDGCSSSCGTENLDWQALHPEPPSARAQPALAYDPFRRRVVMFGGQSTSLYEDTTVEWNGIGWAQPPTPVRPPGRNSARMAYDTARKQLLLFGGSTGTDTDPLGDMWSWDGDRWTSLQASGPDRRDYFGMVYDSARQVVVLFGGYVDAQWSNDTWEWDGQAWHLISLSQAPEPRSEFLMAYDPKRAVVVLVGGFSNVTTYNDTWEYDGTTWRKIVTATPSNLLLGAMAYDTVSQRMIAYGGWDQIGTLSSATYAYDGTSWVPLGQSQPGPLYQQGMATDATSGKIVMYGGENDASHTSGSITAKTWLWNGSSWSQPPAQQVPTTSAFTATAYDALDGREWMFGGEDAAGNPTSQLWSYDGSIWMKVTAAGGPSPRYWASAVYDAARHNVVLFGGTVDSSSPVSNQTWLWDGQHWSLATPTSTPPERFGAVMAYDANRQRVVLWGGIGDSAVLSDTWEWDGDWHPIAIAAQPTPRAGAEASFDPIHGIVVRDGYTQTFATPSEVIAYDGTAWTIIDATVAVPPRAYASFIYEPLRHRSLLIDGISLNGDGERDMWEWDSTAMHVQQTSQQPPARGGANAFPGPNGADVILFGGTTRLDVSGTRLFDTWRLRFDSPGPREDCDVDIDADHDGLAGCADPDCWARCTPLCPPGATCDPGQPRCGDGTCNAALENCRNCPADCTCTSVCGDAFCDTGETHASCPGDCP